MKIGLIGAGNISRIIANGAGDYEISCVYDLNKNSADEFSERFDCKTLAPDEFPKLDLIVEAASQEAVVEHVPGLLARGQDVMVMSVGAFADEELLKRVRKILSAKEAKLILPSGAIGGLDLVRSAKEGKIDSVRLTTTKPPGGLDGDYQKKTVVFEGSAKEACKKFPKNVNVSATLSLAGIGFDRTEVIIVADPKTARNTHEIEITGDFGRFYARFENLASPDNPKTSYVAAMSAVATIKNRESAIVIG